MPSSDQHPSSRRAGTCAQGRCSTTDCDESHDRLTALPQEGFTRDNFASHLRVLHCDRAIELHQRGFANNVERLDLCPCCRRAAKASIRRPIPRVHLRRKRSSMDDVDKQSLTSVRHIGIRSTGPGATGTPDDVAPGTKHRPASEAIRARRSPLVGGPNRPSPAAITARSHRDAAGERACGARRFSHRRRR